METLKKPESYEEMLGYIEALTFEENEEQFEIKAQALIEARLEQLEDSAEAREVISLTDNKPYRGFISSATEVRRTNMLPGFHVNDPGAYLVLLRVIRESMRNFGASGIPIRQVIPTAIFKAISDYYGNVLANSETERANQDFYSDFSPIDSKPHELRELKGQGFAVCAEKAALGENYLAFVNLEPQLMMADCNLHSAFEGHAYNIVRSGNTYGIFEPTNPRVTHNKDGQIIEAAPALYPITTEQYETLMHGGQVTVIHKDYKVNEAGLSEVAQTERVYSG